MENAVEALYMAGAALIFLLALSVSITSFSNLREGVDNISHHTETIQLATDDEGNYINYISSQNSTAIRQVGAETVVSAMYRSSKENYTIYIKLNPNRVSKGDLENIEVNVSNAGNNLNDKDGNGIIAKGDNIVKITIGSDSNQDVHHILEKGFYKLIKDCKFQEYLGVYQDNFVVSEENKITYRSITFVEI